MKRMIFAIAFATLLGISVAPHAFAQETAPKGRINKRQSNQQKRIAEGEANGSLTDREANRLEKQEDALHQEIKKDRADGGGLTARERRKIERQQDGVSRRIAKQKHDGQTK
jgi:hypothetical protein